MEEIRLYKVMNVDKSFIIKDTDRYIFRTEKKVFKTNYLSHIPVVISDTDFEALKGSIKTYRGAKKTPIIHEIRKQAIKYLKDTNRFNH